MLVLSDNKQQRRIYKGLLLSIAYASAIGGIGMKILNVFSCMLEGHDRLIALFLVK